MKLSIEIFTNTLRLDLGKTVDGWNAWMIIGGHWYRGKGKEPQEALDNVYKHAMSGEHVGKIEERIATEKIDGRTKEGKRQKEVGYTTVKDLKEMF